VAVGALAELLCRPHRALRAFGVLFRSRDIVTLASNLAVYPRGLWLGRVARRWRADHIHAHWISTNSTIAMTASEVSGIPWSCTAHRGDIVQNNLLELKRTKASFVRFISASGIELARALAPGAWEEKSHIIHMGIRLPDLSTAPLPAGRGTRLACIGNLIPVKGHVYLLRAMEILKRRGVECSLDVIGDGELAADLRKTAEDLSVSDRVSFAGFVANDRVLQSYDRKEVGIVVTPSIDLGGGLHEGVPVSLMEAMAYGIPVISTTTGGIPELLRDGAGILVPPQDPGALADAIERLVAAPELRGQLGAAGRKRVEREFSVEQVVSELIAKIEAVGGGGSKASSPESVLDQ
jgi:glycosyltransferase involved in cell wall biosynthesis